MACENCFLRSIGQRSSPLEQLMSKSHSAHYLKDYLLDLYELENNECNQKIKEAKVAIMVDELCDNNGCCVIDIVSFLPVGW